MREPGSTLELRLAGSGVARYDLERNRLLRLDSFCVPVTDWKDERLSIRLSKRPGTSTAEVVVGVEATVGDAGGGSGNGALELRRELFEKEPGLSRPAAA